MSVDDGSFSLKRKKRRGLHALLGGLPLEYTVVKEYTASRAFEVRKTGVGISLVSLVCCVTLIKFFNLSEPLFPYL